MIAVRPPKNNSNNNQSTYLTMNGESHDDMISFSLYACSIWPWLATSHFFSIFNANVSFLLYCTNSTRPNPPTPNVPTISNSDNRMWSYSSPNEKRDMQISRFENIFWLFTQICDPIEFDCIYTLHWRLLTSITHKKHANSSRKRVCKQSNDRSIKRIEEEKEKPQLTWIDNILIWCRYDNALLGWNLINWF